MLLVSVHSTLTSYRWGLVAGPLLGVYRHVPYRLANERVRWPVLAELWRMSSLQNVFEAK